VNGRWLVPLLLTALAAIAATSVLVPSGQTSAGRRVNATRDVSANWSGYVVTGPGSSVSTASGTTSFTDVTGTWTVPTAVCGAALSSAAAIWVGLGGYSVGSQHLEQAGTDSDCDRAGSPMHYAWYELVPAPSVQLKLKISPGDVITSTVLVKGSDILVQVKNRTRRTVFTKHLQLESPDLSSAEWIAEAPSECSAFGFCRVVALTNFGTVTFSKVAALGNQQGGTITSNPGWTATPIQLVPQAHRFFGDSPAGDQSGAGAGATPSGLSPDGTTFSVNYTSNAAVPTG
jgi:peptidase A4-like protein